MGIFSNNNISNNNFGHSKSILQNFDKLNKLLNNSFYNIVFAKSTTDLVKADLNLCDFVDCFSKLRCRLTSNQINFFIKKWLKICRLFDDKLSDFYNEDNNEK